MKKLKEILVEESILEDFVGVLKSYVDDDSILDELNAEIDKYKFNKKDESLIYQSGQVFAMVNLATNYYTWITSRDLDGEFQKAIEYFKKII